jgi:hypothetical protein
MMEESLRKLLDRYDDSLRHAMERAAADCAARKHYDLEIEHLLLQILKDPRNSLTRTCEETGPGATQLSQYLENVLKNRQTGNTGPPRLHPSLRKLLTRAADAAGQQQVTSGFLYLELLDEEFAPLDDILSAGKGAALPGTQPVVSSPPRTALTRSVHVAMTVYLFAAVGYVIYGLVTDSGLIHYWVVLLKSMEAHHLLPSTAARNLIGVLCFFVGVPAIALCLPPYYLGKFAARKFSPPIAVAMTSWGTRPVVRDRGIPTWKGIAKLAGVCLLLTAIAGAIFHWYAESEVARRIYVIDVRKPAMNYPRRMKHVRLKGVVLDNYRLLTQREDGSHQQTIAPLVGDGWSKDKPIRYFLLAEGDSRWLFSDAQANGFSGEINETVESIQSLSLKHYQSLGLKVDEPHVFVQAQSLPASDSVPVSYDELASAAGLGCAITLGLVLIQVKERFDRKRSAPGTSGRHQ